MVTTEIGWRYKFDSRSNNTVQKRRCIDHWPLAGQSFLRFLKDGLRKFYD